MIIISYDISDDRMRTKFSKMITKRGAIRLQYSVYEMNNTSRIVNNLLLEIEKFSKQFTGADSVVIFTVGEDKMIKYGNAIHRDEDLIFL